MIITCTCGAKLKIGDDKLTEAGVRIKCPRCGMAHVAKRPAPVAAEPVSEPAMPWFASASSVMPQAPPVPAPSPKAVKHAPASPPPVSSFAQQVRQPVPSSSLVLVAHDSKVVADMIQGVVSGAGLTVEHATDGLEALKMATALKPRIMIVDVGLTGIYGFELCERLKGDPETRSIKIILLSSVYGLTAYKRNPVTLYGADDYIEKHHIPDKLLPKLKQMLAGQPAGGAMAEAAPALHKAAAPAAERIPAPLSPPVTETSIPVQGVKITTPDINDVMPRVPVTLEVERTWTAPQAPRVAAQAPVVETQASVRSPVTPAPAEKIEPLRPETARPAVQDESVKLDASFFEQDEYAAPAKPSVKAVVDPKEIEKARRFARLVVSDIALYNQETVTEGIAEGTFYGLLKDDIAEGRALYDKRVPEAIRATDDYYQEAFDNFIAAKKKQR
jgi:CheY-like chemotaxis protein